MSSNRRIPGSLRVVAVLFCLGLLIGMTSIAQAAYRAHGNNKDVDSFLTAYPSARASALDDCVLCHPGGQVAGKAKGSCDFCHGSYGLTNPHGQLPLNQFAVDFLKAGRNVGAFAAIGGLDSDHDGYPNAEEIRQLTNPGSAADHPGLKQPPAVTLSPERIRSLSGIEQFMLMNTTKSGDFHAD